MRIFVRIHMYKLQAAIRKRVIWIAASIAAIFIFHICYGLETLDPTNISWLMTIRHDWGTHYLGWAFFRNEPWHFPLGDTHNYFFPVGTNVGFTDSIPLFALIFKLFGSILPQDFQYFGWWVFLCHLISGYYAIKFLRLFKVRDVYIFFIVLFIIANPVLIYRGLHPALCAHWLLIGCLYLYFLHPLQKSSGKTLLHQFILLMLSALINPYLCFMVLGFNLITPMKKAFIEKSITKNTFFTYQLISITALVCIWYITGMLRISGSEDLNVEGGYGLYSLNLNSLYNSFGFSSVFPALKQVSSHQYEGFMYLGLGIFFLILVYLVSIIISIVKKSKIRTRVVFNSTNTIPLLVLLFLYTLFALTHVVSLNDRILFRVPIPGQVIRLGEIFRASSRFFWVVYYLAIFGVLIYIVKAVKKDFVLIPLFMAALIFQFFDIKRIFTYRDLSYGAYVPPVDVSSWNFIMNEFDEIHLYPAFQTNNLKYMDYQDFCYLASHAHKPITTGYVARMDNNEVQKYNDSILNMLDQGIIPPGKVFITTVQHIKDFSLVIQSGNASLNMLDGYCYLYDKNTASKEMELLSNQKNRRQVDQIDSILGIMHNQLQFVSSSPIETDEDKAVRYSIEKLRLQKNFIYLSGWAFLDTAMNNKGDSVFFVLKNRKTYHAGVPVRPRPDVTSHFNRLDLEDAGFDIKIFTGNVDPGIYELMIGIRSGNGDTAAVSTGRMLRMHLPDFAIVRKAEGPLIGKDSVKASLEVFENKEAFYFLSGWAFFPFYSTKDVIIEIVLKKDEQFWIAETDPVKREDVTAYFNWPFSLENSGFTIRISRKGIPEGKYRIGIRVTDKQSKKSGIFYTDREIVI